MTQIEMFREEDYMSGEKCYFCKKHATHYVLFDRGGGRIPVCSLSCEQQAKQQIARGQGSLSGIIPIQTAKK